MVEFNFFHKLLLILLFPLLILGNCKNNQYNGYYKIPAEVDSNFINIVSGTKIIYKGLVIGFLEDVQIDNNEPQCNLYITSGIEIPKGSTFCFQDENFLGEKVVSLELSLNKEHYESTDKITLKGICDTIYLPRDNKSNKLKQFFDNNEKD